MTLCLLTEEIYGTFPLDDPTAWTGGARSVISYQSNCWYGWNIQNGSEGVACGLNTTTNQSTTYQEIEYGFLVMGGVWYGLYQGAALGVVTGTHNQGNRYYVYRIDGSVVFCVRPWTAVDADQYFDVRFPGFTFPGAVQFVAPIKSYGQAFLDTAIFQQDDGVESEATGVRWTSFADEQDVVYPNVPPTGTTAQLLNNGASAYLDLPLSITGTGTDNVETPILALIDGQLPITGGGTSRAETTLAGELPLDLTMFGGDVSPTAASLEIELTLNGQGIGSAELQNGIRGTIPLTIAASSKAYEQAGIAGELPAPTIKMTGTDDVETPITSFIDGELAIIGVGIASDVVNNYFNVAIEFDYETPLPGGVIEISEVFYATTAPLSVRYVNIIDEELMVADVLNGLANPTVEVTELIQAFVLQNTALVMQVSELVNIDSSVTADQIIELAEKLYALGVVQSFFHAVLTLVGLVSITDSKVSAGGGSSGGGGGGIIIIDPTATDTGDGTSGSGALITLSGSFPAGTEVEVTYETDTGGESVVTTTMLTDSDETQAATAVASDLDAQGDVIAVVVP